MLFVVNEIFNIGDEKDIICCDCFT